VEVPNILGGTFTMESPGYVQFTVGGQHHRLEPVLEDQELFFIFRDASAGKDTYPAGRFLYTAKAAGGKVTLDFNRAVNPPCAFTPYATCPLPPRHNTLSVPIRAGELRPAGH
jgi:uncharacterized protein (DUF1684 family)